MFIQPDFLIANFGFNAGFVWFIRALLYMEIVQLFFGNQVKRFIQSKASTFLLFFIWILDIILMKYSNLIFGFIAPEPWGKILTKFIGNGLLYYMIGMKIKVYEKETAKKKTSNKNWILYILIAIILNIIEFLILDYLDVNQMPVNYIFTFPCVLFIFMYLFTHKSLGKNTIFCFIDQNLSMYIYYWHGLLAVFVSGASKIFGLPRAFYSNAFVIYFAALVFALIIYYCKPIFIRRIQAVKSSKKTD